MPSNSALAETPNIVDIRGLTLVSNTDGELIKNIKFLLSNRTIKFTDSRLTRKGMPAAETMIRSLPTMLLYDDKGLEIFDKITYDKDYYLTNSEIDILVNYSRNIVRDYVKDGSVLIELGAGAMRKTRYLLEAIVESKKKVTYCAVDLAKDSLTGSLSTLVAAFPSVEFIGLWGTYNDSLDWVKKHMAKVNKMYIWLGSSIGNYTRSEAVDFLAHFEMNGMDVGDTFLCGVDRRNSFDMVSLAYKDRSGLSREFSLNGLDNANSILKQPVFERQAFEFVSIYNEQAGRHEAYFESLIDQTIKFEDMVVELEKGELINFEYSYKYSSAEVAEMLSKSKLSSLGKWTDSRNLYDLHLFTKSPISFPQLSDKDLSKPPTIAEWEDLWKAADFLTTKIIDPSRLSCKPIELRHPYIFYLGHLPSFFDIQMSRALGEAVSEPAYFAEIFERGIDPLMEDPSRCHNHSKVPCQWPDVKDIIKFRDLVRERYRPVIASGNASKRAQRAMTMCYEHDAMHIETLLYMVAQDDLNEKLIASLPKPIFEESSETSIKTPGWISMTGGDITMGLDDPEADDLIDKASVSFGWDNEKPQIKRKVKEFKIQSRPVTVGEYKKYLDEVNWEPELIPASWIKVDSTWMTRSFYGPLSFEKTLLWPVSTSQHQAALFASHYGWSLPEEEQLVYARSTASLGFDNHSFTNFTPQNVQVDADVFSDVTGNGWEWTKTEFSGFPGFIASEAYSGYSADFFDGKHFVALGGSWATAPRISRRTTFRNWYQSKYPYVFSKFRCVKQ